MQPEYEPFGQFQKFGKKMKWGTVFPYHPKENSFCTESEFLLIANCASDLTFLAPLTSEI